MSNIICVFFHLNFVSIGFCFGHYFASHTTEFLEFRHHFKRANFSLYKYVHLANVKGFNVHSVGTAMKTATRES